MQKKRRLFNIRVDEVSLVDKAANTRKFLIMKRDGEKEVEVEELKKVLENIEKAINDLSDRIGGQDERMKALEPSAEELQKAGAKFSKATLGRLKTIHSTLGELLAGIDFGDEDNSDVKKSSEEISAAVLKGIQDGMIEEKNNEDPADIKKVLEDVIRAVLKETKE